MKRGSTTTVVIADDHAVVRHGVRALLADEAGFLITGEASDGLEALALVGSLKPDVLVVDLMMPCLSGLEVCSQVAARSPRTRVVILSMYDDEPYVVDAMRNGARGYVLKESTAAELVQAVRAVAAGHRYLSPPLSERALDGYLRGPGAASPDLYEALTPREREVLHLAVRGYSSQEIAARLRISPRTAETHRANLMRKLGLHSLAELIRYALRHRLLPFQECPAPGGEQ